MKRAAISCIKISMNRLQSIVVLDCNITTQEEVDGGAVGPEHVALKQQAGGCRDDAALFEVREEEGGGGRGLETKSEEFSLIPESQD